MHLVTCKCIGASKFVKLIIVNIEILKICDMVILNR